MEYIKSTLWEINKSFSTRALGFILALTNIYSYFNWQYHSTAFQGLISGASHVCWPFFKSCDTAFLLTASQINIVFGAFTFFSTLAVLSFLSSRLLAVGWLAMLIALVLKSVLYLQDYRFSSNVHYILFIVHFCYLLFPQRKLLFKFLVLAFYLNTGLLKINSEWLSGSQVLADSTLDLKALQLLSMAILLIECVVPFGLFFKHKQFRLVSLITLMCYNIFIWASGGGFYALVQLSFLVVFALEALEFNRYDDSLLVYQSYIRPEPTKVWIPVIVTFYAMMQLLPILFETTQASGSEGHLLSLNPIRAKFQCENITYINQSKKIEHIELFDQGQSGQCDPYIIYRKIKSICDEQKSKADFKGITEIFIQKHNKSKQPSQIFKIDNFCDENIKYTSIRSKKWMVTTTTN